MAARIDLQAAKVTAVPTGLDEVADHQAETDELADAAERVDRLYVHRLAEP
jgi:hypothetical protein